ncbi:MAG: hypothetical protein ACXACX_12280 [Candidatus Hodarchaeales archaeon]
MFEIIDGFKKGYATWKLVWLRQIIVQLIIGFVLSFLIVPFGFLIAIFASNQTVSDPIGQNDLIIPSLIQMMLKYPGFWFSAFATFFIMIIIVTILAGLTQNIAHQRLENENVILEDNFKGVKSLILPLAVVSIVTTIIMLIPLLIAAEIFHLFTDPNAPVVFSFPIFDSSADLSFMDVISAVVYFLIFIFLIGPYFLAISSLVVDNTGVNSIVEGWKLYFQKFVSVVIAMIFFLIIGFISFLVIYLPVNGIVIAGNENPTNLPLLFFSIFLVMIVGILLQYVVNNWIYTSLYCFYKEIKE